MGNVICEISWPTSAHSEYYTQKLSEIARENGFNRYKSDINIEGSTTFSIIAPKWTRSKLNLVIGEYIKLLGKNLYSFSITIKNNRQCLFNS